ncbi:MAG: CPBP family intramembrane metalloprotease [Anaerolineae bacterium]|nr:CPBP family intramembrane metalloprotease [Anaerolineae bacterium]
MIGKNSNFAHSAKETKRYVNPKLGIVFIILIILQFYLLPLISLGSSGDYNKYINYQNLYTISSYSIIVLSILIFHINGLDVFRDHFSLWTIVLTCFLAAGLGREDTIVYKTLLIFLGLILSIYIIVNRKSIRTPSLKSVFIGLLWSVGTIVITALLIAILNPIRETLPPNLLTYTINTLVLQLSFVAVIEEAYFRGLLFGFMVMNGYKENTALIIQAILFWGAHYMRITVNPVLFFVAIPILTLSTTLIIKKYKMLYLSIIIHTLANVFGPVLVAIF